jgi:hypothetical protein
MNYTFSKLKYCDKDPEDVCKSSPFFILKELTRLYSKIPKNIDYVLVEMKSGKLRMIEIKMEIEYLESILIRYLYRHKHRAHISCKYYFELLGQLSSKIIFKKEMSYFIKRPNKESNKERYNEILDWESIIMDSFENGDSEKYGF